MLPDPLTPEDRLRLTYWKFAYRLRHDGFTPAETARLIFHRILCVQGVYQADLTPTADTLAGLTTPEEVS